MLGPSCREVAERVGRDELDSLGRWDRLLTRLHLLRCRHCRAYAEQLRIIGGLTRGLYRSDPAHESTISRLEESILEQVQRRFPDPDGTDSGGGA